MARSAKLEWSPCGLCGVVDGPILGKKHVTPSRYSLSYEMVQVMPPHEVEGWATNGKLPVCGKCKNRICQRVHREALRREGKTPARKPMRDWEPPT